MGPGSYDHGIPKSEPFLLQSRPSSIFQSMTPRLGRSQTGLGLEPVYASMAVGPHPNPKPSALNPNPKPLTLNYLATAPTHAKISFLESNDNLNTAIVVHQTLNPIPYTLYPKP